MTADNLRATTAMFRVFGDAEPGPAGEANVATDVRPMHVGERRILAVLVPLTVFAALWSVTNGRWIGFPALVLTVIALNLLPLALGGREPGAHWHRWLAVCGLWSAFHAGAGSWTAWVAWVWIGLVGLESAALLFVAWRCLWRLDGNAGIAARTGLLVVAHLLAVGIGFLVGWPWALLAGALIAACYCKAVLDPSCPWLGPVATRVPDGPLVTIDDGPDPHDTPLLLDLLDLHQRKAVFFLIGTKAAAHPELVREIVRRGHEIGNHTMHHPQASFWCAGPWRTRREIHDCQEVLEGIAGTTPRWFRAPVGHRNFFTHPVAAELGLEVMAWSRRGYDAVETDVRTILSRITQPELSTSDIVLLHESTPVATEVLAGVLGSLRTEG